MTCEWCEKADATDGRGLCADCRKSMEAEKQVYYRIVGYRTPQGVQLFNCDTRSGHRNWQYNQSVGTALAVERFHEWAEKTGWIEGR